MNNTKKYFLKVAFVGLVTPTLVGIGAGLLDLIGLIAGGTVAGSAYWIKSIFKKY